MVNNDNSYWNNNQKKKKNGERRQWNLIWIRSQDGTHTMPIDDTFPIISTQTERGNLIKLVPKVRAE